MVKLISLLTTLALILTSFAACSSADDSGAGDTTAAHTTFAETEAETEPVYELDVPDDLDYDGYTFRFLGCPGENETSAASFLQFSYNEETGDLFNDSIYRRNEYVK